MAQNPNGKIWELLLLALLIIALNSLCTTSTTPLARSVENIGNPTTDLAICDLQRPSYICDSDGILTANQDAALDAQIRYIFDSTTCPCKSDVCSAEPGGYLIIIALVDKLLITQSTTNSPLMDPEQASQLNGVLAVAKNTSYGLLEKWNLGRCKESVVVLYSKLDNVLYTAPDVVASQKLTSDLIGEISMDVRIEFSQNITLGFQRLLTEYQAVFNNSYTRKTIWDDGKSPEAYPVIGLGAAGSGLDFGVCIHMVLTIIATYIMQL